MTNCMDITHMGEPCGPDCIWQRRGATSTSPYLFRFSGGPVSGRRIPSGIDLGTDPPEYLTTTVSILDDQGNIVDNSLHRYELTDHVKYDTGREVAWYDHVGRV